MSPRPPHQRTRRGPNPGRGPAAGRDAAGDRDRFEVDPPAGPMGTWRWDVSTGTVECDPAMAELIGYPDGTFPGSYEAYRQRIHPEDLPDLERRLQAAVADRNSVFMLEHRVVLPPDGQTRWLASSGRMLLDARGRPAGLQGVSVDVSQRHWAEDARRRAEAAESSARAAAERSQRRMQLLARVSQLIATPLDLEVTLQHIADLAVAELADWCLVDLLEPQQPGSDLPSGPAPGFGVGPTGGPSTTVAHRDPGLVAQVREINRRFSQLIITPRLQAVVTHLRPLLVEDFTEQLLSSRVPDPRHRAAIRELMITSVLVVPLAVRGTAIGTMTLLTTHGRRLSPDDTALAVELGRRAGSAVEKARLYAERDRVARTLQRSLMPPRLPALPGAEVAARLRPWTAGTDVGGDFYDVVEASGRWWLVLGDVCGKGPGAAAQTAGTRYALRALVLDGGDPVRVLDRLNTVLLHAVADAEPDTPFTTLALAALTPAGAGFDLRLVSAGHPPPLIRRRDGRVEPVHAPGMPVGLFPQITARPADLRLEPGDALLLYTDGVTEARDQDGVELGEMVLRELLSAAPAEAQQMVDAVMAGVLDRARQVRDDVALLGLVVDRHPR